MRGALLFLCLLMTTALGADEEEEHPYEAEELEHVLTEEDMEQEKRFLQSFHNMSLMEMDLIPEEDLTQDANSDMDAIVEDLASFIEEDKMDPLVLQGVRRTLRLNSRFPGEEQPRETTRVTVNFKRVIVHNLTNTVRKWDVEVDKDTRIMAGEIVFQDVSVEADYSMVILSSQMLTSGIWSGAATRPSGDVYVAVAFSLDDNGFPEQVVHFSTQVFDELPVTFVAKDMTDVQRHFLYHALNDVISSTMDQLVYPLLVEIMESVDYYLHESAPV